MMYVFLFLSVIATTYFIIDFPALGMRITAEEYFNFDITAYASLDLVHSFKEHELKDAIELCSSIKSVTDRNTAFMNWHNNFLDTTRKDLIALSYILPTLTQRNLSFAIVGKNNPFIAVISVFLPMLLAFILKKTLIAQVYDRDLMNNHVEKGEITSKEEWFDYWNHELGNASGILQHRLQCKSEQIKSINVYLLKIAIYYFVSSFIIIGCWI